MVPFSLVQLYPGDLVFYILFFVVFECGVVIVTVENYYRWNFKSEELASGSIENKKHFYPI